MSKKQRKGHAHSPHMDDYMGVIDHGLNRDRWDKTRIPYKLLTSQDYKSLAIVSHSLSPEPKLTYNLRKNNKHIWTFQNRKDISFLGKKNSFQLAWYFTSLELSNQKAWLLLHPNTKEKQHIGHVSLFGVTFI